ncbi:ubiquitin-conjugating enzyme e2 j1 [Nannochloropsis gaditana]|uniref:Ubiquitin-conjugating enzyme e2 j1 n=2 Tax=Nannochloropsis gaditana TaxID=72520 RepID=W7TJJ9_9STRA|nr:ubiquitin-conjugating enzyme e2 j1 [Nannochloropsis gaditana]
MWWRGSAALLSPPSLLSLLLLLLLFHRPSYALHIPNKGGKKSPPGLPRSFALSYRRLIKEWRGIMAEGLVLMDSGEGNCSLSNNTEHIRLAPCRGNLHEWHFSVAGPPGSVYEGGIYHGRVILPANYPQTAPRLQMLNPSGRFEVGADICLSATSFHQETWQPVWTVRTLVSALRSHMATPAVEVGGMECSARRRKFLARRSRGFLCRGCGVDHSNFPGRVFRSLPEVGEVSRVPGRGETRGRGNRGGRETGVGVADRAAFSGLARLVAVLRRHKVSVLLCLVFWMCFLVLNASSAL